LANFDSTDDIALISNTRDALQDITTGLQNGMKVGLRISSEKTRAIVGEHQAIPLTVEQKDIEYVDTFQYLGRYMSRTGDVDTDIHARIGKASACLPATTQCLEMQQHLHEHKTAPLYVSRPTYCHICRRNLDISGQDQAHAGCVQEAMSAKYPGLLVERSRQQRRIVRTNESKQSARYRRQATKTIRWSRPSLPSARPVSAAVQWTPEGGKSRRGRPRKTWQDTLRDDLQAMDVSWEEAKSVAGDRHEWR